MRDALRIARQMTADGRLCMVRLSGTLCVATVPALRESLASGSGRQGLLVDLSGVRALDAAGLRALLSGYVDAADRGCTLGVP